MRDVQHYYVELHAKGFKHTNKFSGFDSCCAHFNTRARVGTMTFQQAKMDAVKFTGDQQVSHGWVDYTVGKTFVENGSEPVSVMSPAYEYHKGRSFPTYEEVK